MFITLTRSDGDCVIGINVNYVTRVERSGKCTKVTQSTDFGEIFVKETVGQVLKKINDCARSGKTPVEHCILCGENAWRWQCSYCGNEP